MASASAFQALPPKPRMRAASSGGRPSAGRWTPTSSSPEATSSVSRSAEAGRGSRLRCPSPISGTEANPARAPSGRRRSDRERQDRPRASGSGSYPTLVNAHPKRNTAIEASHDVPAAGWTTGRAMPRRRRNTWTRWQSGTYPCCAPRQRPATALEAFSSLLSDAKAGDLAKRGEVITAAEAERWFATHLPEPLHDLVQALFPARRQGSRDARRRSPGISPRPSGRAAERGGGAVVAQRGRDPGLRVALFGSLRALARTAGGDLRGRGRLGPQG